MEVLIWIEKWFASHCDNDWEHTNGVTIRTIDNPGWEVSIDIKSTKYERMNILPIHKEKNELNWYTYKIEGGVYSGYGDPTKLSFLLNQFKEIIEAFEGLSDK